MAKTVSLYECEGCKKPILKPDHGVVVHGNIYVADPENKGGLIGNNFPTQENIRNTQCVGNIVEETAYCIPCFLNAVNIKVESKR